MPENLETLRKQRNMKAGQLAAKSGVPIKQIAAYEKGERIKVADMPKLARALFVDESAINWVSVPPPPPPPKPVVEKPKKVEAPDKPQVDKPQTEAPQEPQKMKKSRWPKQKRAEADLPARPSQIDHALMMAAKVGEDETAVTEKAGKPLTELTQTEASQLIMTYQKAWLEYKKSRGPGDPAFPDNQGKRALTPEAVDRYEVDYLQARQEAGDELTFTLFDGSTRHGRVIGFSPYNITIQEADARETTLQKLGVAYYSVAGNQQTDYRLQEQTP
ncbi:MAG: helix-turn-helix transcriptional regulator [Anaerolineae bacterium]|nr:helix-turn-helix transcriptional regulator [Anaerolineae bacterium]